MERIWTRKLTFRDVPIVLAIIVAAAAMVCAIWGLVRTFQLQAEIEGMEASRSRIEVVEETGVLQPLANRTGRVQFSRRYHAPPHSYVLHRDKIAFSTDASGLAQFSINSEIRDDGFDYKILHWEAPQNVTEVKWKVRWLVAWVPE